MWNILLDPLPEEWHGYPIDSDFQTGIQISQCLIDEDLSETEQFCTAVNLLFPDENQRPGNDEAAEGLIWFLTEFYHDNKSGKKSDVKVMDFDIDQWRIYAAFLNQYHIDLNTEQMHWFTFMGLLSNLDECAFTNVMNIRQKEITSKMSPEERKVIKQAKRVFAIRPPKEKEEHLSAEEEQAVDEFRKLINQSK